MEILTKLVSKSEAQIVVANLSWVVGSKLRVEPGVNIFEVQSVSAVEMQ